MAPGEGGNVVIGRRRCRIAQADHNAPHATDSWTYLYVLHFLLLLGQLQLPFQLSNLCFQLYRQKTNCVHRLFITMQKAFTNATKKAVEGSNYTKFTQPKVSRGKTAFPSGPQLQKQLGVRYDYDGEVKKDGVDCHKFQVQPNAGEDIPSSIKRWRQDNGGTHQVMAVVYVKKDGTKSDVEEALEKAHKSVKD